MAATAVERPDQPPLRVELADGRRVVIRLLTPDDAPALVAAVKRANPWDLRRRFMGSPPPPSLLIRRLQEADGVHDVALGAFTNRGRLVGVAQFDRVDDGPSAEVAIEVAQDWQQRGLGTSLLTVLARYARAVGVRQFTARYFADNQAIRKLLHEVGRVVSTSYESGEGSTLIDISEIADEDLWSLGRGHDGS